MTKKIVKRVLIVVALLLAAVIIAFVGINLYLGLSTPKTYIVETENRFDYQAHYECSGYSSAYVLRSLGIEANGIDIYNEIDTKNDDGTVPPKNLVEYLKNEGYDAKLCTGTTSQLKLEISKGTPVIVFVRVSPNETYYHFLPIVGYDEESFFAAESLKHAATGETDHYNRVISNADFEKMWATGVEKDNTYITISK